MAITLPVVSRTSSDDLDYQDVYVNDAQLVSEIDDRDGNYQTILTGGALTGANTTIVLFTTGGSGYANGATTSSLALEGLYFDDADYAISSKTQKLRVRAQAIVNTVAPTVTYTVGLYPVSTIAGSGGTITYTAGTVVSGSTATPSVTTSSVNQASSGDFTIPSDGFYALGVVASGSAAGTTLVTVNAQLQTRWV